MKTLFTIAALILSFFSTPSFANASQLGQATDLCNEYYKVAVVSAQMKSDGMDGNELLHQVYLSAMPDSDKDIVMWIISEVYSGTTPSELFNACYDTAFEMYGEHI